LLAKIAHDFEIGDFDHEQKEICSSKTAGGLAESYPTVVQKPGTAGLLKKPAFSVVPAVCKHSVRKRARRIPHNSLNCRYLGLAEQAIWSS